jgi:hypothetical protein
LNKLTRRFLAIAVGFAAVVAPGISSAHYWFQRAVVNPVTVTVRGATTPGTPVLGPATTAFWCRTPAGANINGPHATLALAQTACDLTAPAQTDAPQRVVVEVATRLETTTTTTAITQTTPRTNVYGGSTLRVSDAHAQMMVLSGGSSGGGGGGGGGDEPYDLSGFSIHFDYSWPTAPVTTTTVNVDTCAEWQAAANDVATTVNVAAGNYGACDITVTGSDLDFVISTSATIDGGTVAFVGLSEVRWTGGNLVDGGMRANSFNDLLIDDFCVNNFADNSDEIHNFVDDSNGGTGAWSRLAIINSTFALYGNTAGGGSWALYINPDGFPEGATDGNLILANFKVKSDGGQNNRFMAADNTIIVDSVFNPDGLSVNGMRFHQSSTDVFIGDTWIRGLWKMDPTNGADTGPSVVNARFDNVDSYYNDLGVFGLQGSTPNTGTAASRRSPR